MKMIVRQDSVEPINFYGLRIYDYTAGQDASSSLATIQVTPGTRHPEAWSKRSDKYYYVVAGQIRFVLDGDAHDLKAGDFCLVHQGQRFWYQNKTSELSILLLVHTPGFDLESEVLVE
jgi:mannose-6-phosphate isomerase-like protein (cupin superfamily)